MHLIGIGLAVLLAVVGCWMIAKIVSGGPVTIRSAGSTLPCSSCKHCRKLFDDGAICSFYGRETFKTLTHVGNSFDWKSRSTGRRTRS